MATSKTGVLLQYLAILVIVIGSSFLVSTSWVQKKEVIPERQTLTIQKSMTLSEFASVNQLDEKIIRKVFELKSKNELSRTVGSFGFDDDRITTGIDKAKAIEAEHGSKNWQKILTKFVLWIVFLVIVFFLVKKVATSPNQRKLLYLISTAIFGVVLGADPSAMGTVKDAVALFAEKGVIFPPRMIALTLFLIMVVVANKLFCGWGCQFGALQELIFRINRSKKDRRGIFKQYKLPFVFTNSFRILFFSAFCIIAFVWAIDIYEYIDPFKIFKPGMIALSGWVFMAAILLSALFVYRPWCSLFCPFGLVGWLFEKLSVFKIKVNYDTCIACESCARSCPSTAMESILKREKTIVDCYSCSTCLDACPTGSISFSTGKRDLPPTGKYDKDKSK
ncbi:MAG: 4Fe-4S binding protein [Deltaproteobacteria bacterium]|nr:4Fe-4S binding protein [Deltaproteobacteria bacterium]